jgi:hypothetical protein
MKKFALLFACLTLMSFYVSSQPQLTWQFANAEVINAGTQLQFDVQVKASAVGSYQRDLQIYFDYNTLGFGSNIVANGKITYTPLSLLDASQYLVVNMADNTSSKFAIITEAINEMTQPGGTTYYKEVTTDFQGLLRFTIDIAPGSNLQAAGIAFDQALMNGGQYKQSTTNTDPVKYTDPCLYANDLSTLTLSSLYGTIVYNNFAQTPLTNCNATLYQGASVIDVSPATDVTGLYMFTGIPDGAYTIQTTLVKAVGGITTVDGILIARFAVGLGTFSPLQFKAGDVNVSGSISTTDGILVKRRAVGLTSPWPAADYVFEVPNASVASGLGTSSFKGLCSGDVNGSYTPPL